MTTSNESSGPVIPDFELDAQSLAAYASARSSYQNRELSDAEERTRTTFAKRRAAIRAEIAVAATLLDERREKAQKALRQYAARYPQRIARNEPVRPSFWESLFSFGSAGRMYRRAVTTAADVVQAQALRRRKESEEEELEGQLRRALYLQEDALKKNFEAPEGIAAFHGHPGVADLHQRTVEIAAERAIYAARLERGEVSPEEQRDREFAENETSQLALPFAGVAIVRIVRYGDLTYFILRDLERKLYKLAYDPRLELLLENVFDIYRTNEAYDVRLTRGTDGRPLSFTDHYNESFEDAEVARAEYRRERTFLRAPRPDIAPMSFQVTLEPETNEGDIIEMLATFAPTIGPGATGARMLELDLPAEPTA